MKKVYLILLIAMIFTACSGKKESLTVSAAASMTELMNSVEILYEKEYKTELTINLASSGTLKRQIEQGAPVDIFVSASSAKMDGLSKKGLIDEESRENILKNSLVLIVNKDSLGKIKGLEDLESDGITFSIGEPDSVPAGSYARESLKYYKIWDKLSGKTVYAKNVKQVLYYVESGEVDAGIVYSSDAIHIKNSEVVVKIDSSSHRAIVYPIAVIKDSENKKEAVKFLEFMKSDEVKEEIVKAGFEY